MRAAHCGDVDVECAYETSDDDWGNASSPTHVEAQPHTTLSAPHATRHAQYVAGWLVEEEDDAADTSTSVYVGGKDSWFNVQLMLEEVSRGDSRRRAKATLLGRTARLALSSVSCRLCRNPWLDAVATSPAATESTPPPVHGRRRGGLRPGAERRRGRVWFGHRQLADLGCEGSEMCAVPATALSELSATGTQGREPAVLRQNLGPRVARQQRACT